MDNPPPLPNETQTQQQRPRRGFGALTCLALGCLGAALCFFGLVFLVAIGTFTGDAGVELGSESVLRVRLADLQRDGPLQGGMFLDPADAPLTAAEIARAIRRAGEDGRIEALYLVLDGVGAGWAVCREVREALLEFRDSGKPSVAAGAFLGMRDYYVASACDKIALAPGGVALVNGTQASVTYFKRAFDKIGVDPEFEHVGDYKSAVEPYERSGPSAPAAEAYESMLVVVSNVATTGAVMMYDETPLQGGLILDDFLFDAGKNDMMPSFTQGTVFKSLTGVMNWHIGARKILPRGDPDMVR